MPTLRPAVCHVLVLFVLLVGGQQLLAQPLDPRKPMTQYDLRNWTKENGLPQNTVNAILQTKDGFLWLGTYQGLSRFDGLQFQNYNIANTPELRSNGVYDLLEDQNGTLWIATNGGLVAYRRGNFKQYSKLDGLPDNVVTTIYQDRKGRLWLGTGRGVSCFVDGKFQNYESDEVYNSSVLSIAEDEKGVIWVGTRGGLYRLVNGHFEAELINGRQVGKQYFFKLLRDRKNNLWIGTDDGLFHYANGKYTHYSTADGLTDTRLTKLYEGSDGTLWIGTLAGGLNRLYNGRIDHYSSKEGADDDQIQSIYEDREGSLWFGTSRAGLFRMSSGKFANFGLTEGMHGGIVYAVLQDVQGTVWAGNYGGGLSRLVKGVFEQVLLPNMPRDAYVRALHQDGDGSLWIALYGQSLLRYQNGTAQVYGLEHGLIDNWIRCMVGDSRTGLYIGTRNGLSLLQNGRFTNYTRSQGMPANSILCMATDRDGRVWMGTDGGGIGIFKNGKIESLGVQHGLSSEVVLSLHYDAKQNIMWVGTNSGLNVVQGTKVTVLKGSNNMYGDAISSITTDRAGNLWMGSNNGVYFCKGKDLREYLAGTLAQLPARRYDQADGMRSSECTPNGHPSSLLDREGRIWLPTSRGLTVIDPALLPTNPFPPIVTVHSVISGQKQYYAETELTLPAGSNRLTFMYAGLCLKASERVQHAVKLEGYDNEWIQVGNRREAFYTNLSPGNYTFMVRACNNDGLWTAEPTIVRVVIKPHFYQSLWFWGVLLALLVGGVSLFVRWRIQTVHQRNKELEQRVQERTAEVYHQQDAIKKQNDKLNQKNAELELKTSELQRALDNFRQAQEKLILSEKMAVLGQLVANIAHEINTPLSAVTTSARNSARILPIVLRDFPHIIARLNAHELELFQELVLRSIQIEGQLSTKEERELRRALENELQQLQVAEPHELATKFVHMRITGQVAGYLPLMQRPDALEVINMAMLMTQTASNNDLIRRATDKTTRIVTALKSYSYRDNTSSMQEVDLGQSVDTILTLYDGQLRQGIEVVRRYKLTSKVPVISEEIEQVWTNIIHNAMLAMEGKGVLEIGTDQVREMAVVRFTDSGRGIPSDVLPRIFEPFFTTRPKGQGSGLGLDICKMIIEKHGGSIEVDSIPGMTTFSIYLPVANADATAMRQPEASQQA